MPERILIVDDDPVQRRLLENMVTRAGYEAVVAEGGEPAAALLLGADGARIDAVVLDLMMPDLDGLGVLARIREAALATPVIVQTAHGGIDNVVTAMRAGAADFVVKPVGAERLAVSLRNALAASALVGELNPVGARKPMKIDVRLISATNRDLIADVKNGRFREDLFYRLHVFPIAVPALAERPEDIPELVRHFLARFAAEEGKRTVRVSGEALTLLISYRWPGNVRQLENAVFRAVVLAEGDEIGLAEFPQIAAQGATETPLVPDSAPESSASRASAAPAPLVLDAGTGTSRDDRPRPDLPGTL